MPEMYSNTSKRKILRAEDTKRAVQIASTV